MASLSDFESNTSVEDAAPADGAPVGGVSKPRRFGTRFSAAVRWLHIYVSMLGMAALMFFAVTGLTLNHPEWIGENSQRTQDFRGTMDAAWLRGKASDPPITDISQGGEPDEVDHAKQIARLEVVEFLRDKHQVRGSVTDFYADEYECAVSFKRPGYLADALIDRETGDYTLTVTQHGVLAVVNDLHLGRNTGVAWKWLIDVSAGLLAFVSLTGLVLLFYLKRKRIKGVLTAVAGTIILLILYFTAVA